MKVLLLLTICLSFMTVSSVAQTEIQIKKTMSMKIPGMEDMKMPPGMANPMMEPRPSTEYIKGARMRTDTTSDEMTKFGKKQKVTNTIIQQCDKQRRISFNSKNKKYFVEPMSGQAGATESSSPATEAKTVKKGGYVTISGGVTDTGERAKLFGYNAKHLKQTITMTPSKDACQKGAMKIDIDGWYIDLPEWSCPVRLKPAEFQTTSEKCYDRVDFQMKGAISGVPVKEIRTLTMDGMTMITEEEALDISKVPLSDAMFEPPAGYTAANTMKEVDDEDGTAITAEERAIPEAATTTTNTTLAVPKGGIEAEAVLAKKPGTIRIGIAKPVVQLADKDSAETADDLGDAATGLLIESLKAQNIEAVPLTGDADADAKKLDCDYVVYTNFAQKHGGGGLLGKMVTANMAAMTGKTPQNDTNPTEASSVMMRVMSGLTKGRDEFSFDYKVTKLDKSIVTNAKDKAKANYDAEDVLTPKIRNASKTILTQVKPK